MGPRGDRELGAMTAAEIQAAGIALGLWVLLGFLVLMAWRVRDLFR